MRELTEAEKASLYDRGLCPFCRSPLFHEGPHGGLSVNFYCATPHCEAKFNLAPAALRHAQLIHGPRTTGRPLPEMFRSAPPITRKWSVFFFWRRAA